VKKVLTIIASVITIILAYLIISNFIKRSGNNFPDKTSEGSFETTPKIDFSPTPGTQFEPIDNPQYKTVWVIIRDTDKIELFSNLEEDLPSGDALSKHSCNHLLSGSFYSEKNTHIGLFVTNFVKLSEAQENTTFNGYFFIDEENVAFISSAPPQNPKIAVQSGPILMRDEDTLTISLERDENARRIIAAVTDKGEVVFIAIYDKSNTLLGPKLTEVPSVLSDLQKNTAFEIKDAINLDGGSHSAFITNLIKLTEISTIGSYFCIKP